MTPLSYQARTETPDGADIDRIVNAVIAEAQHAQLQCHPADVLPPSLTAKNMAREIKRRLSQLIRVEVDLVVTGISDDASAAPAGGCLSLTELCNASPKIAFPVSVMWADEISVHSPRSISVPKMGEHTHNRAPNLSHFFGSLPGPI